MIGYKRIYIVVSGDLKNKIKDSIVNYRGSDSEHGNVKLPSELTLSETYNVSRSTIREILAQLTQEGIVYKLKGKGSFIRQNISTLNFNLNKLYSVNAAINNTGATPSTHIVSVNKITANDKLREKLDLKDEHECVEIKRIRYADNKVAVYSEHYFKVDSVIDLSEQDLHGSIFSYFDNIGIKVSYSKANIKSAVLTKAQLPELGSEIASFLLFDEIFYKENGEVVGYTNDYYSDSVFTFDVIRKKSVGSGF